MSPHAAARERALFILSLDADRARRAAGLPGREKSIGWRSVAGETLLQRIQTSLREAVQARVFSGG